MGSPQIHGDVIATTHACLALPACHFLQNTDVLSSQFSR